jgi:hypothetical protein
MRSVQLPPARCSGCKGATSPHPPCAAINTREQSLLFSRAGRRVFQSASLESFQLGALLGLCSAKVSESRPILWSLGSTGSFLEDERL